MWRAQIYCYDSLIVITIQNSETPSSGRPVKINDHKLGSQRLLHVLCHPLPPPHPYPQCDNVRITYGEAVNRIAVGGQI